MRHVALLTSTGSQEIELPPRALQREFFPFFEDILDKIRARLIDTVAIDGRPGAGKTQFALGLSRMMQNEGVPFTRVGTDDDTLPRHERNGKEIVEYHPGLVLKEAIQARHKGGGSLHFKKYSNESGDRDTPTELSVAGDGEGVLLIEGVRAIEHTRKALREISPAKIDRTQFVLLSERTDVANRRRAARDRLIKGLPEAEVIRRLEKQERTILTYYDSLSRELSRSGAGTGLVSQRADLTVLNLRDRP